MKPIVYTAYAQSSVTTPTVKLKRFWCNNISFLAYQLRNGQIVLSESQMVPQANRDIKKFVKSFISENKLGTLSVTLPNRSTSTVYPLSTVTAVWSNLNSTEQLPLREKKLLASFLSEQPIEDKKTLSDEVAGCINSKTEVTNADLRLVASVVKIKLTKTTQINVLVLYNSYYIEIYEGFQHLGSCLKNPGHGGWGCILLYIKKDGTTIEKELSGGEPETTNNRMEILAAIGSIPILQEDKKKGELFAISTRE